MKSLTFLNLWGSVSRCGSYSYFGRIHFTRTTRKQPLKP